jgi:hypothetical protein
MTVAANDGHARLSKAIFRANNMHNTILFVSEWIENRHIELSCIFCKLIELVARNRVFYRLILIDSGCVVVGGHGGKFRTEHLQTTGTKSVKCLRTGHFVAEMTVDVQLGGAVFHGGNHMGIPDFVKKRFTHIYLLVYLFYSNNYLMNWLMALM